MKNKALNTVLNGILRENPVFALVLGMCPTLATTTSAINGMSMGLATTFVLICSNVVISLLKNLIPDKVRIPAFIVVIATFVTMVQLLMQAYLPAIYEVLGLFIPLIVVNCIVLGRAEAFASKNTCEPPIEEARSLTQISSSNAISPRSTASKDNKSVIILHILAIGRRFSASFA